MAKVPRVSMQEVEPIMVALRENGPLILKEWKLKATRYGIDAKAFGRCFRAAKAWNWIRWDNERGWTWE